MPLSWKPEMKRDSEQIKEMSTETGLEVNGCRKSGNKGKNVRKGAGNRMSENMKRKKVIVVGGGPAGMMASYAAAVAGHEVLLIEKNEKLGKKLFITGKGRCNVTNAGEMEELFAHVMSNPKFLYSAFYALDNQAVMRFMEENGTPLKVERGNRVFPVSDHSSDILAACRRALDRQGIDIRLNREVTGLLIEDGVCVGVKVRPAVPGKRSIGGAGKSTKTFGYVDEKNVLEEKVLEDNDSILKSDAVILATGGLSYPSTGSTGEGLFMAESCGHRIIPPVPSLVPFEIREEWVKSLMGLSLRNTAIRVMDGRKTLYEDFGEMLFTHFGVSGPMILSASAAIRPKYFEHELRLVLNLKPALDAETLDRRILREFDEGRNRLFRNAIASLFPATLAPVMAELSGINPERKVCEVTREERKAFGELVRNLPMTITGKRGFAEAIITKGGISVKDVDPSTMRSKKVPHLSFCGEALDLDATTGGYNLQIAWSTGYLAGTRVLD